MTDIVQEHWDQVQNELNQERRKSADLLADSKRWEKLAKERQAIIDLLQKDPGTVTMAQENIRLTEENRRIRRGFAQAEKYIGLLGTHLLNKRLGKLGLHQNNQISFAKYKELVDKLDGFGWLYPPRTGNYSQRLVREKFIYKFEEYMKCNWRDSYTKCIDHYNRTHIRWRE